MHGRIWLKTESCKRCEISKLRYCVTNQFWALAVDHYTSFNFTLRFFGILQFTIAFLVTIHFKNWINSNYNLIQQNCQLYLIDTIWELSFPVVLWYFKIGSKLVQNYQYLYKFTTFIDSVDGITRVLNNENSNKYSNKY